MWARVKYGASGRSEDDVVGNSPRVRRELAEGIESMSGWHKGVHRKKIETHWKIVGGSRKAFQELRRDAFGNRTVGAGG
ncbi:hypothetical protein BHM03_00004292 [Ensete ventricosum]|nr:hypothetical protein BHM03_00004292 [Ensete ventricosum]